MASDEEALEKKLEKSELKNKLNKTLQDEVTEEYKTKLKQQRESDRLRQMEEIKKGRFYKNDEGHEVDRWDEVIKKATRVINEAAMSYNDWRASMSSLISLCTNLNLAVAQSRKELLAHIGYGALYGVGGLPGLANFADAIGDKISDKPEITLPTLQHLVEYSDDNVLHIAPLQRFEGDDIGKKGETLNPETGNRLHDTIDKVFEAGVYKWLDDLNYKKGVEPGKWVEKDTGEVLTKERFNELKNDPDRGLGAVLSDHFDLNLEERPGPKP